MHRLMAALWMARAGVRTLVVDRNAGPTDAGHADGLESRTIEILDSFGLGRKIWDESNHTIDICLWVMSEPHGFICYTLFSSLRVFFYVRADLPTSPCRDKVSLPIQLQGGHDFKSRLWVDRESRPSCWSRCWGLIMSKSEETQCRLRLISTRP